jgi:hypothetical protein
VLAELLGKGSFFQSEKPTRAMREKAAFPIKALILSLSSMGARSELALNKNKLGLLLVTMNECFLIEQKE